MPPNPPPERGPLLLALVLAGVVTLVNQFWVGNVTLYRGGLEEAREEAHQVILTNRLPPGQTWSARGANGSNVRVLTVWVAEQLRRATGQPLHRVYIALDSAALLAALLLVFWLLAMGGSTALALGGLLFVGALLPLTYHLHAFHPWDRPSLALWAAALILIRRGRLLPLALLLPLAVAVKYDIVLLPILWFAVRAFPGRWKKPAAEAAALLVLSFGTYGLLRVLIPGGFEPRDLVHQMQRNLAQVIHLGPRYPPLLAFVLPVALGVMGLRIADRFERAAWAFAFLQAAVLFLQTNFIEVRAEMPVLVLLMPAALKGVARFLDRLGPAPRATAPAA